MSTEQVDVVIIGAGVVGAAMAQRFAAQDKSVIVLESHSRIAEGVTSRNSGVIHSGIYYPPQSLKARLCIRGKELLYDWVRSTGVAYSQTGKAIVAIDDLENQELENIYENARNSGALGLVWWSTQQLKKALPQVIGNTALFASETGIVDPFQFTRSLLDDAESKGAITLTHGTVTAINLLSAGYEVHSTRGSIRASIVVNSAGLQADVIAKMVGINDYQLHPCRGDYFRFNSTTPFAHLIYPVKAKGAPGLGIHLTLDLAGGMRLGPDTEYVESRNDFSPREDKKEQFRKAAEKLFGSVSLEQLEYDQCGLRPKLRAPHEKEEKDFVISQDLPGFINLIGIESPGLTSAMAIAEYVSGMF